MLKAFIHYKLGHEYIDTKPAFLKIEVSRKCEVKCLHCSSKKDNVFYSLADFQRIIDAFTKYVFLVSLYDIGEPLENIDIVQYIRYAHNRKIGTIISSNLSTHHSDDFWKSLVTSGLDKMIVAIDGITPETYNKYRTQGDFTLVLDNLKKILNLKNETGSSLAIEWQMIDFEWNKHEQSEAHRLALELGVDSFRIIQDVSRRKKYEQQNPIRQRNCLLPYIILIINAYNQIRPCYKIYSVPMEMGNFDLAEFDQFWNGDEIRIIRSRDRIIHRTGCRTCIE